ncbi:N-acetylglutaminylglutamine amidotransferase [Pseudohalioglobus sediminis]|uniref:asparagine synthase (glutamine-hydrolyzing) n=1 Tax=Pseudohalioglobus sediminis TaxID=2606449 RepID=A0A5B0X416_9GAMM|nr:N-acetylglutaminylglutamine amidotransferase [Pseudohalioglobus sediminis]KAA1194013.1 N-acetylglutaminylglutamine amidotransferase [Pseudohalioglobus sediminis]
MCGIAGIYHFDGQQPDRGAIQRMTDTLAPRGPDGSGVLARDHFALGHRRLKVIDLSDDASQPMSDPDLGVDLVFNGCIYNYKALRRELQALNYRFFSTGDTEVVLKALHAWGVEAVEKFNGMFAFAAFDHNTGRFVIGRDRLGIKPLYVAESGGRLAFASTLPALLEAGDIDTDIDPVGLNTYMSFHSVAPAPHTILQGVRKLPPATVRTYYPDGRRDSWCYWSLEVGGDEIEGSFEDVQQQLLDVMRTAVKRRMVADVPVGVLLSGGVDSSLIVALLAEQGQSSLSTFSVGFESVGDEAGDEFKYSDLVASQFGTDHHQIRVPTSTLLNKLPAAIDAMSEPMVSHDNVGFFLLSQEVSRHLKVVQSGQGADEIFGGYHWYPPMLDSDSPVDDYMAAFADRDFDEYARTVNSDFVAEDFARAFVESQFAGEGGRRPVDKALHLDTTVMLVDDPVKRVDNMTMAFGLEARVPFLDHEVVEFAARVPASMKVANGGKHVLKEAARKVLPKAVIDRPKGYFPVPELTYIRGPVHEYVSDVLDSSRARNRGLFNQSYVNTLLDEPEEHITPLNGSKLWQVALLESWLQSHSL